MNFKKMTEKCPNCGTENIVQYIGGKAFCSKVCEQNYKYRKAHEDPLTGLKPNAEDVHKI